MSIRRIGGFQQQRVEAVEKPAGAEDVELEEDAELEEAKEADSDPGAESCSASLEDIAELEEDEAGLGGSGGDALLASLDDIVYPVPEPGTEAVGAGASVEHPKTEDCALVVLPFDLDGNPGSQG